MTTFNVGDIVTLNSGKIRYELLRIDAKGYFYLSALPGQGERGYLPPHKRDLCLISNKGLKLHTARTMRGIAFNP